MLEHVVWLFVGLLHHYIFQFRISLTFPVFCHSTRNWEVTPDTKRLDYNFLNSFILLAFVDKIVSLPNSSFFAIILIYPLLVIFAIYFCPDSDLYDIILSNFLLITIVPSLFTILEIGIMNDSCFSIKKLKFTKYDSIWKVTRHLYPSSNLDYQDKNSQHTCDYYPLS